MQEIKNNINHLVFKLIKIKYIYKIVLFLGLFFSFYSCSTQKNTNTKKEKPVVIKNDRLSYEVIIFDLGFNRYLNSVAKPVGFYSQSYLENKNRLYVQVWNYRVSNPNLYDPNIYENTIDYRSNINYGYDVNYKLFNYFEFAQQKYRMTLR